MAKFGSAVLDGTLKGRESDAGTMRQIPGAPAPRRDLSEDFAAPRRREEHDARSRGLRFRLAVGVPRSAIGRGLAAGVLVAGALGLALVLWGMRTMLLHEPRLVIESSSAIQITGNKHLTRPQLLSVFGEDVDRNILTVPLTERRAELERLPWVEHATVMRLLPNRFRVAIVERTPVAFVRQGSRIGLVDGHGVLLDMVSGASESSAESAAGEMHYSFPVLSGVMQSDPLSTRAARMKLFARFEADLDAGGGAISKSLSEVDLSNPEDVKALVPSGKSQILVHFGDRDFLRRYELFAKNAPGWQAAHPRLASADMRYEHEVVLEMEPGAAVPEGKATVSGPAVIGEKSKLAAKRSGKPLAAGPAHRAVRDERGTPGAGDPKVGGIPRTGGHLQTSFDVRAKSKAKAVPQ